MKRTITYSFLFATCFAFFTSCSKDVKAPAKVSYTAASTNTSTGTETSNQNQTGHTCGQHSSNSGNGQ